LCHTIELRAQGVSLGPGKALIWLWSWPLALRLWDLPRPLMAGLADRIEAQEKEAG